MNECIEVFFVFYKSGKQADMSDSSNNNHPAIRASSSSFSSILLVILTPERDHSHPGYRPCSPHD